MGINNLERNQKLEPKKFSCLCTFKRFWHFKKRSVKLTMFFQLKVTGNFLTILMRIGSVPF
jgi:hypothetical protein